MQKKLFTGLLIGAMMAPALVSAQSAETQSQIQSLLTQIRELQVQLKTLLASSTSNPDSRMKPEGMHPGQIGKMICIGLSRNLRQGDQGDDVRKLQEMLAMDPENGFSASATGFFGPLTMRAMAKFQMRMGIASSSDGSVGPLTRGFFQRRCGMGLDGVKGPDAMKGSFVRGTISANNTTSISIQTEAGTVTVVHIMASTSIKVFAPPALPSEGTVADLMVGKNVSAEGQKNDDGSIVARMIAIGDLPAMPALPHMGQPIKDLKDVLKDILPGLPINP